MVISLQEFSKKFPRNFEIYHERAFGGSPLTKNILQQDVFCLVKIKIPVSSDTGFIENSLGY